MKNKANQKTFNSRLLLLASVIALSSCSSLNQQSGAGAAGNAGSAAADGSGPALNGANSVQVVPELTDGSVTDQQALIDQINRDGQRPALRPYSDPVPSPESIEGEDVVQLNYEQADLRLVLEELAAALDITILIDPTIDRKISIRTSANRPLARDDVWPLIRLLTRDAGVLLEREGNVYNARLLSSGLAAEITTPETLDDASAALVMQVTPITYVSTDEVMRVMEPLLEPGGNVIELINNGLLVITGTDFQLRRVNELLLLLDSDPFSRQGIHLYQLSNASALEVATELSEILLLIEGQDPAYQVKGIESINSILVTAPAGRGFDQISRWVEILDADSQEQIEQLFLYPVKNLNAVELAETLTRVFEEDDEDRIPLPLAQQAAEVPAALSTPPPATTADGQAAAVSQAIENAVAPIAANNAAGGVAAVSANLTVKIVADEATNSLLIRSTAKDYRQLLTTINELDAVPLQVMVNAVIAQITLTEETKFGVDWSRIAANADLDPISTSTSTNYVSDASIGGLMFTKTFLDGSAMVDATLQAIAVNNDVDLLSRPSLTVINNQEGEIQIGAEVPIEQGQTVGVGGAATTNIQYRPTGIELTITPQINVDGIVNLTITQVLSSVDSAGQGVNNNPVFNNQEITTTVVVRDGENIVLGGLIQTTQQDLNTGVPGLNTLPYVGNLFSFQQESLERRELFIVLRPEIIDLNANNAVQFSEILDRFDLASKVFEDAGLTN